MGRKNPIEPKIERCSHFADGSARCLQADGVTLITKEPNELENYISTNPNDFDKYDQYCHRSTPRLAEKNSTFDASGVDPSNPNVLGK